jgi:predicted DNA-binding protein (MmcQ/YjbR family)
MQYRSLESSLLEKPEAVKEFPFGPETAVFKVAGKMFSLTSWQADPLSVNLKCDPDDAYALPALYPAVQPGYHMSKDHWNTVTLDGSIPEDAVLRMIDESYALVVKGLRKTDRLRLQALIDGS